MDVKLQTDFHDRFIADSNTLTLAHFTCNGAKIIDWIDANFISRAELKDKALSLKNPYTDPYQNTAFNIGAESVIAILRPPSH